MQITNKALLESMARNNQVDSLGGKLLPGQEFQAEEKVYLMPMKELYSDSRMPINIPNPEINYTILD